MKRWFRQSLRRAARIAEPYLGRLVAWRLYWDYRTTKARARVELVAAHDRAKAALALMGYERAGWGSVSPAAGSAYDAAEARRVELDRRLAQVKANYRRFKLGLPPRDES